MTARKTIEITVVYDGQEHCIKTYPNEYRSLMMLLYDKVCTGDFGDCLGMGKCGTCLIQIDSDGGNDVTSYERNEGTTIEKAGLETENVRLSCQIMIDNNLHGMKITIR